jgi:RNA polymerase sigma-70 factor (ECF subfamily)
VVDAASAEEQALAAIEHRDVIQALNRPAPELQAVLHATVLDGLSTREAAALLGIPAGTVKTRTMRARLREELAGA